MSEENICRLIRMALKSRNELPIPDQSWLEATACDYLDEPELIELGIVALPQNYLYGMRLRGFAPMCQPKKGFIECREGVGRYHNIIVYNRILSNKEMREYELDFLGGEDAK